MSKSALVIVDVQNDYFPGGAWELKGQVEAAQNVKRLLEDSRSKNTPIIHIQHVVEAGDAPFFNKGTEGVKIHETVLPQNGEPLVVKQFANSFLETNLKECWTSRALSIWLLLVPCLTTALMRLCVALLIWVTPQPSLMMPVQLWTWSTMVK